IGVWAASAALIALWVLLAPAQGTFNVLNWRGGAFLAFYLFALVWGFLAGSAVKRPMRGPNTRDGKSYDDFVELGFLAGGAERGSSPTSVGGFCSMKAMSTRNDDPTRASRPWDKERDGFVLGDGAGILVLEEYERAKARGARIYCELAGFGATSDAFHMTAPSENGEGPARCMVAALKDAGINADEVGYLNAHGTSTPLGDLAETLAIKRALGDHAYKTMVSSTKSMTGHLLGAAGGAEAIFSVLALHHNIIPPTINLDEAGEGCDLDYVPNTARDAKVDITVSNGFGFGGTNGTLVFKRI
ncbi:beta-ketoacyl-ACP synthase II, partial [Lysobacter sp. 2RAB21]